VGAEKGIMISVHGWTSSAKTYAGSVGIDLMRLIDAENKIWGDYFGQGAPEFKQVVMAPTLVTHRSLEITFHFQSSRTAPGFQMPYDTHDASLVHEDGTSAGTPVNLVGSIWADEDNPREPGAALVIVDLARPVFFEIDPSRAAICRILFYARITEQHRFGMWQLAKNGRTG
jgi:hypothetical protein